MGAVVSASGCSTLNSSISASTLCTFTANFLKSAPLFLVILRLMTHMRTGLGVLFDVVLLGKFYVHVGLGGARAMAASNYSPLVAKMSATVSSSSSSVRVSVVTNSSVQVTRICLGSR